jgi:hypothetical protein
LKTDQNARTSSTGTLSHRKNLKDNPWAKRSGPKNPSLTGLNQKSYPSNIIKKIQL